MWLANNCKDDLQAYQYIVDCIRGPTDANMVWELIEEYNAYPLTSNNLLRMIIKIRKDFKDK